MIVLRLSLQNFYYYIDIKNLSGLKSNKFIKKLHQKLFNLIKYEFKFIRIKNFQK